MRLIYPILIILVTIFLTCANQGFPPGGPEDKTPAHVVRAYPPADTTNVPLDSRIIIEFSEPVQPRSCEEALFITPFPGENVRYKWKRDRILTISFADSLLKNRTYIVTIGAGTKDRRNNAMTQSFTLAFSTGPTLDQGRISGRLFGEKVEGAQIWAYDLAESDTPNPASDFPLYVTQTGKDGVWWLTNLALSRYRLFAIMDRDVNSRYNAEFDLIGVPSRDVILDSLKRAEFNINFRLVLEDTTQPRLASANAPDNRHVDLRFDESMRPDSLQCTDNYIITSTRDTLPVLDAALDHYSDAVVHLTTALQDSGRQYTVQVKHALNEHFLPLLADSSSAAFAGSAVPDTSRPRYLAMIPKDSSEFVPLNAMLQFIFSKAMQPESVQRHLIVADTLGDTIPGDMVWKSKAQLLFEPSKNYKPETTYFVTLPVDSVFDLSGNALADTLFERRFTTINPDTLSAISGSVTDADTSASGPIYLTAHLLNEKNPLIYRTHIDKPGPYKFPELMPGRYSISLFRDQDQNGRFSPGRAYPFQPAERYYVFPDTIEIRSRWPSEGEDIELPQ